MLAGDATDSGGAIELIGRREELAMLDRLVVALAAGESRALVVRGDAGVGKTALLDHLARSAVPACRVVRTSGVQAEMELAFAGLHQLCLPLMDHLVRLPEPQRVALSTALGLTTGPTPDRFLAGLAVLNLLSYAAEDKPLLCLVDDEQWLDRASAQVLAFVARRLVAESVGLVFAARVPTDALAGLPALVVSGLRGSDARLLLESALVGPIDPRIRDQIIAETGGNPLALLELPRGLSAEQLAGGFGLPEAVRLSGDVEAAFRARIETLPPESARLLLVAAADPTGDVALMWRAAALLGLGVEAAASVVEAELASFTSRVRFRHPLVRSAAYRSAALADRRDVHRALATATDEETDPDRRAWHRALASVGPDETVAADLERSAARAQARGGVGAAAAFLERAATLSGDPEQRAERALAAASAKVEAGAFDAALDLLGLAESGPLNEGQKARTELVRGRIAFVTSRGSEAPPLLLSAADKLIAVDADLARGTYLEAMTAAMFVGRLAVGADVVAIARTLDTDPRQPGGDSLADLLLDWLVVQFGRGYVAGVPWLRRALAAFTAGPSTDEHRRWVFLAGTAAHFGCDDTSLDMLTSRHVDDARATGALSDVPLALSARAIALVFFGDLDGAAAVVDELQAAMEATGSRLAPYAELGVAAMQGHRDRAAALIESTVTEVTARGEGNGLTVARWAEAVLHNGHGDYRSALIAAQQATDFPPELGASNWSLPELIEAAARTGAGEVAAEALGRLDQMAAACATPWALGLAARSRALTIDGDAAERCYREAIDQLSRTRVRAELARAHLVYGEWLRRERRRSEARTQLRTAHAMFVEMGMGGFAERARRELNAVGDTPQTIDAAVDGRQLTAQEAQVARMARDGLSNAEIGARLFISARTVQYHLSKVFTKLGITSRAHLDRVLP
ncbi:helix-turn-helix transcriptional regulator [Mycolicibacterium murale]|uniref:Helix-turn-helix transcriptional regulator n=1 Tax=Mycolicibacterium murale TaxID=182220 RepID=A0A7I9WGY2_9MYCO|nr:LuxR family transcriptional regulator [Mycolicibacterium murale]GFG56547.1 helix-turn-helix transcriptional regulator [Mycolicibacterium murale]